MTEPRFDQILVRLVRAETRFVLIGGFALNAWGVVRGTKDVDIVVDPEPGNLQVLAAVAVEIDGQVHTGESFASTEFGIAAALSGGARTLIDTRLGPLDVIQGPRSTN